MNPRPNSGYVNVLFDKPVISAIDKFRDDYGIESRTDAIRRMIEYALKHKREAARGK